MTDNFYLKRYHAIDIDEYVLNNCAYNSVEFEGQKLILDKKLIDVLGKYVSYYRIAMNIYCNEETTFENAIFSNIGIFTRQSEELTYQISDEQYEQINAMTLGNYQTYYEFYDEKIPSEYGKILMNCKKLKYLSLVIDKYYWNYDLSHNDDLEILHLYFKDFANFDILKKIPNVKILIIMMKNYTKLNENNINLPTSLQKLILVKDKNYNNYIEQMPKIKLPFGCLIDYCAIDFRTILAFY